MSTQKDRPSHRVYATPELQKFGTLRDVTLAVGMNGNMDGGATTGMMMTAT